LAAKAAIKDVGRVLNIPLERVNYMTKLVPTKLGTTLDDTLEQAPDFRKEYDNDSEVRRWIDIARKLEGTNRNSGTHAAGVVIANGPINEYVPVHRVVRKGDDAGSGEIVITTQWVMGDIEKVGMLKMDFLGLRTLTVLDNCVRLIKQTRNEDVDMYNLPLDDAETYALLQRGDAKGVFQFESQGIRDLLKRLKPDNIRDIIACTALYRPGPLEGGMVDSYVNRKHKREQFIYEHPVMEEVLGETFNIMVYQEQVMRILNRLGGIELSSAYACIKAISKKKQEIIDARKIDFIKGAQAKGISERQATELFDLIVCFGGYGFNKSHSAAYAHMSYQTAYLKTHYTPEFMAALLSSEIDDGNKRDILVEHIFDARTLGVQVLAPDVNTCGPDFTVEKGKILFGLTAIKGLGRQAATEIERARRAKGPFADLYDFCERIDSKLVSKAALEKLVKAGALECFGHRAAVLLALPKAIQQAAAVQSDRKSGQLNFFDLIESSAVDAGAPSAREPLPSVEPWTETEKLKYEKEALDFYFSSHPLAQYDADLRRFALHSVQTANGLDADAEVCLGGMLSQVRMFASKKSGDPYVRCKLEDFTGLAECVMWPSDYARFKTEFDNDRIVLAYGKIDRSREEPIVVLNKIMTIDQARKELTKNMLLCLRLGESEPVMLDTIARVLKRTPGPCTVYFLVTDGAGKRAYFKASDEYRINPATVAIDDLEKMLGRGAVQFSGK
jgi:DNA polymerase-3 subunit alpha